MITSRIPFGAAVAAWVFGIAGLALWYEWNGLAKSSLEAALTGQHQEVSTLALAVGIVGVALGIVLAVMALRGRNRM
jgi:hypothetical protein